MDASELVKIIERGEDSKHQFKERAKEPKKLADEMIAFSNSQGGEVGTVRQNVRIGTKNFSLDHVLLPG